MDLSPPSMYNTTSSSSKRSQRSAPSDQQSIPTQMPGNHRLDIYGYRLISDTNIQQEALYPIPPSTTLSGFSDSFTNHRMPSKSSPNILSAEYDPFAPFQKDMGSSLAATLFSSRSTEMSLPPNSPSVSAVASHRSSFSSAAASETYSHPESYPVLHHRVNRGNTLDWSSDCSTGAIITAPQTEKNIVASSSTSYQLPPGNSFFREDSTAVWPKDETLNMPNSQNTAANSTSAEAFPFQEQDLKTFFGNAPRTRTPRKMTTREDANYQCKVKGCGKLFSRSYNFKAHKETHDSSRVYPFPCPLPDCNKKFVRKTDLQRHHQSVHMKERNFCCDFCNRYFARKDTLRRHMEDGCSKRFDLAMGYSQYDNMNHEEADSTPNPTPIHGQFSSTSNAYPSMPTRPPSTLSAPYTSRADVYGEEDVQGSPWAN